jgi:site-specific recombinase XerC
MRQIDITVDRYIQQLVDEGVSPRAVPEIRQQIRVVLGEAGVKKLSQLMDHEVVEFFQRAIADDPASVLANLAKRAAVASRFFDWCIDRKFITSNPCKTSDRRWRRNKTSPNDLNVLYLTSSKTLGNHDILH